MKKLKKDWIKYFDSIKKNLGIREKTFEKIFLHLNSIKHKPIIIETGTYRQENNYAGDGCSTLLFDNYINFYGGYFYSVDIDSKACELSKHSTKHAKIINSDSIKFLSKLNVKCDLLYLDSCDVENWENDWIPASHHLKELFASKNIIKNGTLIVVDDNILNNGIRQGKGRLIYELMESIGIKPLFDSYQVGWIWKK